MVKPRCMPRWMVPSCVLLLLVLTAPGCATTSDPLDVLRDRSDFPAVAHVPKAAAAPAPAKERPTQPAPDEPLSLARCVELALTNNPATRSAWLAARSAAAGVGVSRAAWLPEASLDAAAGVSGDPTLPVGETAGAGGSLRLSIGWLLFDGGARSGRVDEAVARLQAADFRHQTALLDVAVATEEAYYQVQGARWFAGVVDELIRQADYQVQLAAARFEVGLGREYDVVQARARLAQTQVLRTTAAADIRRATGTLARAMGLPANAALRVPALPDSDTPTPLADIDGLLEAAVAARPELGEARARIQQALAATRVARAGHYPTVAADAAVAVGYDTRTDEAVPWSAGVGLSIPLFTGFETTYQVRRARYDEAQARADLAGLVTDIQFEVWSAHTLVLEARDTVHAAREVVTAAREAVRLAEENYKEGTGFIGDVFDAQAGLVSARLQEVTARIDWYAGLARLHRAVGRSFDTPAGDNLLGVSP